MKGRSYQGMSKRAILLVCWMILANKWFGIELTAQIFERVKR